MGSLSYLEWFAAAMAIVHLGLAIRQIRWCWVFYFVSAAAYIPVFYGFKLYTEISLQVVSMGVAIAGLIWWTPTEKATAVQIHRWSLDQQMVWLVVSTTISLGLGTVMRLYTDAAFPYLDSAITVFSLLASFMQARKVLENWAYWIVIDVAASGVYYNRGMVATCVLYWLYTALAVHGMWSWRRQLEK
jgi:nicotinamide mononucleotide transporter